MIARMAELDPRHIKTRFVRMAFSADNARMGRFELRKVLHLPSVLLRSWWAIWCFRPDVVYYPPAGPERIPVIRDLLLLIPLRPFVDRWLFHFHAGGVSELLARSPWWLRAPAWMAYRRPAVAIRIAPQNPPDGTYFAAAHDLVVANGLPDDFPAGPPVRSIHPGPLRVLFVGLLCEGKGILVLIAALAELIRRGVAVQAELVGRFASPGFAAEVHQVLATLGLTDVVTFPGILSGDAKADAFARAEVFAFPSHYSAETFGLVLVEAMMSGLPVVATRWRGIPSVVMEGETGFLVPTHAPDELADQLARLAGDPVLRNRLGNAGRQRFNELFTMERWLAAMVTAVRLAADKGTGR